MKITLSRLVGDFKVYPEQAFPDLRDSSIQDFLTSSGIGFETLPKGDSFKYEFALNKTNAELLIKQMKKNTRIKKEETLNSLLKLKDYLKQIIKDETPDDITNHISERSIVNSELKRLYEQDELIKSTGLPLAEIIRLSAKEKEATNLSYSVAGNHLEIKGVVESISFYGGTTKIKLKKED
ncbi:MAG: hypothetical protein ACRCW9_06335 [Cetobacterium sp.]